MARKMTVDVRDDELFTIIDVVGEVDIQTSPELVSIVSEVTDGPADHLVFDLAGVTFMDSTGLAALVLARKKMMLRQGSVELIVTTRRVRAILTLAGLDQVFRVHPSIHSVRVGEDPAEPA